MLKDTKKNLLLAIDTSCDDTACAVTNGFEIWSNIIASQTQLHQPFGGVFPTVAKQAHQENIELTVKKALTQAAVTWTDIVGVAVTIGPGLAPALEVGINYAKYLAKTNQKVLIPVNHLEGHLLSALAVRKAREKTTKQPLKNQSKASRLETETSASARDCLTRDRLDASAQVICEFPALGVIISGGHSEFVLVKAIGKYQRLGFTIDDAAGEALDKVGRMIDLGYPAGPVLEEFAKKGNSLAYTFPLPMTTSGDYNLSFSGLKTYSRNLIQKLEGSQKLKNSQEIYDFSASFQLAVFKHITYKLKKILLDYPQIKQVWLGGGVAANMALRKMIRSAIREVSNQSKLKNQLNLVIPLLTPYSKRLCQDNAAMIGVAGSRFISNSNFSQIANLTKVQRVPNFKLGDGD
jgi:N6-L-threonylcarbamoyladenine synthase